MAKVTVRYWAAAKQAAGVAEETVTADTLSEALAAAGARRAELRPSTQCLTLRLLQDRVRYRRGPRRARHL